MVHDVHKQVQEQISLEYTGNFITLRSLGCKCDHPVPGYNTRLNRVYCRRCNVGAELYGRYEGLVYEDGTVVQDRNVA